MDCYLMRHGEAVPGAPDWQRALSERGRAQTRSTAQNARSRGASVSLVYHSGILRARQTAEMVATVLAPDQGVREMSGLCPNDDPLILKAQLDAATQSVLLVSHLPYLSRLAGVMTAGDPTYSVVEFLPATLACLSRQPNGWKLNWSISSASQ